MNEVLVRATDLIGRPVVTLHGDRHGEIKDVVLGLQSTALIGFTLRNPGFLGGPRAETLPWASVHAIGPDAVMVRESSGLADRSALPTEDASDTTDIPVITEAGDQLGRVVDVVLEIGTPPQVVGLELEAGAAMPATGEHLLLPIGAVTASSSQAIVVPVEATHFVHDDLSGFGAAVEQFRASLGGRA